MKFVDCLLIDKDRIPKVPPLIVEFFDESQERFMHFFFHLLIVVDAEHRYSTIIDALSGQPGDEVLERSYNVTMKQALDAALDAYVEFEHQLGRIFTFLENSPSDVIIDSIEIFDHDPNTIGIQFIFLEKNDPTPEPFRGFLKHGPSYL